MKLVIASNNPGKIREIKDIFGSRFNSIVSLREMSIDLETEEDGDSFCANAMKKAMNAYLALRKRGVSAAVLSDDSGLEVEYLGGAPGIFSARFAGEPGNDEKNNQKLIQSLEGVPAEKRNARYVCCTVMLLPEREPLITYGYWSGRISVMPAGKGGFGYDPYFYLPEYCCTAAQLSAKEKNRISHRAKALHELFLMYEEKTNEDPCYC